MEPEEIALDILGIMHGIWWKKADVPDAYIYNALFQQHRTVEQAAYIVETALRVGYIQRAKPNTVRLTDFGHNMMSDLLHVLEW